MPRAFSPVVLLCALFLISLLVYAIVGTQHVLFDIAPDEIQYAKLSQNFALGRGLEFRGVGVGYPPLYPVLLSWVWHFGSAVTGWQIAKVFGAALCSAVVFPVWLLGREVVGPRLALIPAALCVTGAWMDMTSFLVSENLAYPLAVASLGCTVMAVRDTRSRWPIASVGFAVLAALSRTQLLVLPVILGVALLLDVVRQPAGARRTRIEARPRWLWGVLVVGLVGGLAAYAADQSLTSYRLLSFHVSFTQAVVGTGQHAIAAINMFAFVPVVAAVALMLRPANWRDDAVGPVLTTLVAVVLILLPLLGYYEAYATRYPVDRYGIYLAPLLFLALVLAPGRIGKRTALAAALAVAVVMVWTPLVKNPIQQPALIGSQRRIDALGVFNGHLGLGFFVVGLLVAGGGVLALTWRSQRRGLAAATALVAAVLVAQAWTSQAQEIHRVKLARELLPAHLDWVDRHVNGTVGELNFSWPQSLLFNPNDNTDFYNKRVDRIYAAVSTYDGCQISLAPDGVLLQAGGPTCAPWPRFLVLERGRVVPTLAGQQVLASTLLQGTLIRIPAGPPRLLGIVQPPCLGSVCLHVLGITVFVPSPGAVAVTFTAAPVPNQVALGGHRWLLPAGRETTLRLPVVRGFNKLVLPVSWSSPQRAPALLSVVLQDAGNTTRLY